MSNGPHDTRPAADPAASRRQWQERMAAQQRTGGMNAQQQAEIRRALLDRQQAAQGAYGAPAPQQAAPQGASYPPRQAAQGAYRAPAPQPAAPQGAAYAPRQAAQNAYGTPAPQPAAPQGTAYPPRQAAQNAYRAPAPQPTAPQGASYAPRQVAQNAYEPPAPQQAAPQGAAYAPRQAAQRPAAPAAPVRQPGAAPAAQHPQAPAAPVARPAAGNTQSRPLRINRSGTAAQAVPRPAPAPAVSPSAAAPAPVSPPAAARPVPAAPRHAMPAPAAPLPDVGPLFGDMPPAPQEARPAPQEPAAAQALPTPQAAPKARKKRGRAEDGTDAPKKPLPPVLAALLAIVRGIVFTAATAVKLAALALIPLFVFWYGYTIDRNGWFQGEQYEREIAQAMLAGQNISNFSQMEEREITKLYVQNLQAAPRSIAIGSSRVLQLDRTLVGDDTYFNAGMIGAEYPDVMDSYYLFDRVGLTPGTVIFGVDPWIFSAGPDANTFKRVDMQMYNEFLRYGLGHTDVEVTPAEENMSFWLALTSPAFFHETMDYYIDNKENGLRPSVVEGDLMNQSTDVKMADGSILYNAVMRNQTQEEINNTAFAQITNTLINCEEFYQLDPEHVALFEEFIRYMRESGSEVVFFLAPFHPIAYDWILNFPQRYSGFFQVETWLRQYAAENGIPVYGSYDPVAAGCDETDFFDGWHVRGSGIAKYFPGLAAIDAARASGSLPDPQAVSHRLPTATEDPVL